MNEVYNTDIKTAEMRFFWLLIKSKYPSVAAFAREIGVPRAYFHECISRDRLAVKYAGFLGRKFSFHPGLLKYETYTQLVEKPQEYSALLSSAKFLVPADRKYILGGDRISSIDKHLKSLDEGFSC